ncbi:MAG: NADH-dependent phenylglyoxylate dehydrogenase subunit gamma [Syntrophorhabdaceae bacterium PtaU1.Bin034]|jgi:2-oxoacid:acceptor oxidoreductase gamma subunit (pyruvate/2-ketoisovalerate family)|nr:MAG: NADH-dependent phenylglyoxylate dehydrogenase subunit gamma [Syntrophorhabdaceae bacterium PtaU1.Bin034]
MVEIKFCGRGGQGIVIAAQILARAYFLMGGYAQCYALFGGERRGAPVTSFLRVDDKKIYLKCEIKRPDRLIYFAPDLIDENDIESTLRPGGFVLINTPFGPDRFDLPVSVVHASSIAEKAGIGRAINTTMLGSYCRVAGDIPIDVLLEAIRVSVPGKIEENMKSALRGYTMTMTPEGNAS